MNLSACAGLIRTPENRTWFRAVDPRYSSAALGSTHTKRTRSRFNAGPLLPSSAQFEILYFAEDHQTALFEFRAILGSSVPGCAISNPAVSVLVLNVQIMLREVFDLTQVASAQVPLHTTAQELTGDWDGYQSRSTMTPVTAPTGVAELKLLDRPYFKRALKAFAHYPRKYPTPARWSCFRPTLDVAVLSPTLTIERSYTKSSGRFDQ